jgi:hypothetical protein
MGIRAAVAATRERRFADYARRLVRRRTRRLVRRVWGPTVWWRRVLASERWLSATTPFFRSAGLRPTLPYIEMHLVDHCNLKCRSCSHYSPVSPERFADSAAAERDFARLAVLFRRVAVVRLMGGEPLLHPELDRFVIAARRHLPSSRIALVTNGLLLAVQPDSFWDVLAAQRVELQLTSYPIVLDRALIKARAAEHGVACTFSTRVRVFQTVPMDPEGTKDPDEMYRLCGRQRRCPFLLEGAVYSCARIAMSGILADRFAAQLPIGRGDRLVLDEACDGYDVLLFLAVGAPWCRFCRRDAAYDRAWSGSRESPDEWILPAVDPSRPGVPT